MIHPNYHLLDVIGAVAAALATGPALPTPVAPATRGTRGSGRSAPLRTVRAARMMGSVSASRGDRRRATGDALFIAVDADQVTTEIVLATERATTGLVRAHVRLGTVRVVRRHVGLEVKGTSKG
jgi:hypothetical protein